MCLCFYLYRSLWSWWCKCERIHRDISHGFLWVAQRIQIWIWITPRGFQQPKPSQVTQILGSFLSQRHERQRFPYPRWREASLWAFPQRFYLEYGNSVISGTCKKGKVQDVAYFPPVCQIKHIFYISRLKGDGELMEKGWASGTSLLTLLFAC